MPEGESHTGTHSHGILLICNKSCLYPLSVFAVTASCCFSIVLWLLLTFRLMSSLRMVVSWKMNFWFNGPIEESIINCKFIISYGCSQFSPAVSKFERLSLNNFYSNGCLGLFLFFLVFYFHLEVCVIYQIWGVLLCFWVYEYRHSHRYLES